MGSTRQRERRDTKPFALGAALLIAIGAILTSLVLTLGTFIVLSIARVSLAPSMQVVLLVVLTQGVSFGGVAVVYATFRPGRHYLAAHRPSGRDIGWILGGYVVALAAAAVGGAIAVLLGLRPGVNQINQFGVENSRVFLLLILLAFVLIGPGEEMLFRGTVQNRLREAFGPVAAIVLASAIFAAVHALAVTGDLRGRLVTVGILFLPGLVLGTVYERTRNLVVPILVHAGYDATLFYLAYAGTQAAGQSSPLLAVARALGLAG